MWAKSYRLLYLVNERGHYKVIQRWFCTGMACTCMRPWKCIMQCRWTPFIIYSSNLWNDKFVILGSPISSVTCFSMLLLMASKGECLHIPFISLFVMNYSYHNWAAVLKSLVRLSICLHFAGYSSFPRFVIICLFKQRMLSSETWTLFWLEGHGVSLKRLEILDLEPLRKHEG